MHPHNAMHPLKPRGVHCIKIREICHVVADCVSFATAFSYLKQTPSLIRSVAPPSPAKPTALRGPQIQAAHRLRHAFFAKADGARIPLRLLFRKRSRCTFAARL